MSDRPAPTWDQTFRRFLFATLLVALAFNLWCLTRSWTENLRDAHEFRQFQTALTALFFQKNGFQLAYETPVLGPPWSIPMEFPLYQGLVAALTSATGLPLEPAGRATSLLAFFAAIPALWLLLKRYLPQPQDALVVLPMILVCPVYLFYSRTFMIESTALCFAVWFLFAFSRALERPSAPRLGFAWIVGALAAATKITTFAVVCLPAIFITAAMILQRRRAGANWVQAALGPFTTAAIAASVPLLLGMGWIGYSDALKRLNPYGSVLTSVSLREFNFGTWAQRLTPAFWSAVAYNSFRHVITFPALAVTVGGWFFVAADYRRFALLCLAGYGVSFLTFANLYYVHDYYYYASALLLVAATGTVTAGLLRSERVRPSLARATVIALLVSEAFAYFQSYYSFFQRPNLPAPAIAEVIKTVTAPDAVIAALDLDWNAMIPYTAQRRAIMVFRSHSEDRALFEQARTNLRPQKIQALLVGAPHRGYPAFLYPWLTDLELETQPFASSAEADLYLRWDALPNAAAKLRDRQFPGITLHLPAPIKGEHDLTEPAWKGRLTMIAPTPIFSRGEFPIGIVDFDGAKAISTQAPTQILLVPPAAATHIRARCGVLPGAYQNGNTTDGVVIEVQEERLDGTIKVLFHRSLLPLENPADRAELIIDFEQATPLQGKVVFSCYPGPQGNTSYDWVYWRSISVD